MGSPGYPGLPSFKTMNDQYTAINIIGSESAPSTLTNAYTGVTKTLDIADAEQLVLFIQYTTGAAETNNSVEIKLEFSKDDGQFYQESTEVYAAGVYTVTPVEHSLAGAAAATTYRARIALPVAEKRVKISCKESGVASNAGTIHIGAAKTGI